jgi:D-serine deaminase-like pyridoxal phosphate-dependent protein
MDTRTVSPHSLIGQAKSALDTPALLVDLDVLEANIARIAAACRTYGVAWRPHSKAHKTPEIAQLQIAAGAIGVTCAKLGEAEVMATAGIRDILIANQIVGSIKIGRLVRLADDADPIVCVDSIENLIELDAAFRSASRRLSVAIEVNIGMNRAGVEPGPGVVAFAREIASRPGLRFVGVTGWESHATTIADPAEKERTVREAVSALTASASACTAAGYSVAVVSCGGTGTFPYCAQQPGVTEVQVGGAIFSDMHYLTHYHVDFAPALTVLTTVSSRPTPTRIVVDAGKKTMSGDAAMPAPRGMPPIAAMKLSAEHTKIELQQPNADPKIGDKIELIVGYSDTTVHLHE